MDKCPARDEAGFCIPALLGWPGCFKNELTCECPPDLETARQYAITKKLEK